MTASTRAPRMRTDVDLLCVGEAFEDLVFHGLSRLPRSGEELRAPACSRTVGGGVLITAVAAAGAGARVGVASALPPGAAHRLRAPGIQVRDLRATGEPHAVTVALSMRADRAFVTVDGVNTALESRLLHAYARRLPRARHLHVALGPQDLPAWTRLLDRCRARGITTSWDFGWHEALPRRRGFHALLRALDWVFVNDREARHYAGARTLREATARWRALARRVAIKQGARGAMVVADGRILRRPALRVRVVDTTGAGDAFNGAFLAALLGGRPLETCLRDGVRAGSLAVTRPGGLP